MNVNWHRILMNLRGYGMLSTRKISKLTGVSEAKLQHIASGNRYKITFNEGMALLDCHYDYCSGLHCKANISSC